MTAVGPTELLAGEASLFLDLLLLIGERLRRRHVRPVSEGVDPPLAALLRVAGPFVLGVVVSSRGAGCGMLRALRHGDLCLGGSDQLVGGGLAAEIARGVEAVDSVLRDLQRLLGIPKHMRLCGEPQGLGRAALVARLVEELRGRERHAGGLVRVLHLHEPSTRKLQHVRRLAQGVLRLPAGLCSGRSRRHGILPVLLRQVQLEHRARSGSPALLVA
mmetsp:Transcript_53508/g.135137  ORF Transcript_53508/g.135137 Transcript_53508/m.135137 type:complete len:217 (+) Transcript_53508:162-812(+)